MYRKIIAFILVIAMFICCFGLTTYADDVLDDDVMSLWEALIGVLNPGAVNTSEAIDIMLNNRSSGSCPDSPTGSHEWNITLDPLGPLVGFHFHCLYCGEHYEENGDNSFTSDDLEELYQDAVTSSGLTGINQDGNIIWYPNLSYLRLKWSNPLTSCGYLASSSDGRESFNGLYTDFSISGHRLNISALFNYYPNIYSCNIPFEIYDTAPVTGFYKLFNPGGTISCDGNSLSYPQVFNSGFNRTVNGGSTVSYNYQYTHSFDMREAGCVVGNISGFSAFIDFPYFLITPAIGTSTPPNITNNITNVYSGNNTYNNIVNTTNNQYYDVSNDTYVNMSTWNYDLSTRTYRIVLDDGNGTEVEVEFGDDNITVTAGTTVNNYYYGYQECEPSPSHTHNWTSSVVSERTCTVPGITTYTCEECNETYTDVVPAIGHIWDDGVHHDAVTDPDSGEITTPGYTTYTCSVCGETQDINDGSAPPGSAENDDIWWQNLLNWLAQFKTDLFNKLDNLNISSTDDDTTDITIQGDDFTFNEGDDENSFSFKQDFLAKFGIIKDLWDVGQYVVNIVSQDAANAYSFDINEALSIDTSTGEGEVTP